MAKIFYQQDCNIDLLKGKTIAVIGYGSQGHAHALNAHESGLDVIVGLYEGSKSWAKAEAAGLKVATVAEAAKAADFVMILLPDEKQSAIYYESIAPYMTAGKILAFAHGFNIHFGQITPPADVDVIMIAPKGPGHTVPRSRATGRLRPRNGLCAGVRRSNRRLPRRRFGNNLPSGDGDGSFRRTGRFVRRRLRADAGRL